MPHSSGGGSHSGGSHGGSRGGSSIKTSSKAFPGAKRYLYYKNKEPVFIYANYDVKKRPKKLTLFFGFLFLFISMGLIPSFHNPERLTDDYDQTIIIRDEAGVLGEDTTALYESLAKFLEETGIAPSVMTFPDEKWSKNYTSLENFAYDLYVNTFDDEKHWLIVYVKGPEADNADFSEDNFENWAWEGMQGDLTDPILSNTETGLFNKALHKRLLQRSKYTVGEAITESFNVLTPVVMKKYIYRGYFIQLPFIIILLVVIIICYKLTLKKTVFKEAVECPEQFEQQEACEYCGGIYVIGIHQKCPHCGAPVKAHDFIRDKDGNITGILK